MDTKPSLFLIITWILTFLALGLFTALSLSSSRAQTALAVEPCTTPSPTASATPSPSASPTPTPSPTPSASPSPSTNTPITNVYLTEFMACPASGNEWLELFNAGSTEVIMTNWQVIDETGNKKYLNGSLPAHSFAQFEWTGSLLNNSGDSFSIFTATGQTISSASYTDCTTGISYVYESGMWVGALESPGEDTLISSASLPMSTAAATLAVSSVDIPQDFDTSSLEEPNVFAEDVTESIASPLYQLPFLGLSHNISLPTFTHQPQFASASLPSISVIMGGLFQLLPSSAVLYGNIKKYFA